MALIAVSDSKDKSCGSSSPLKSRPAAASPARVVRAQGASAFPGRFLPSPWAGDVSARGW